MNIASFVKGYKKYKEKQNYPFDGLIYEHIKNNITHVDADIVYAKVVLVNRMYRANLKFAGGDPEGTIADGLVKEKVDDKLQKVANAKFNADSLGLIVSTHKVVTDCCEKLLHRKPTSFVSKYLHFHFPEAFPIFDKYAYNSAWNIVTSEGLVEKIKGKTEELKNDGDYAWFCASLVNIQTKVTEFNLKTVDRVLYGYEEP